MTFSVVNLMITTMPSLKSILSSGEQRLGDWGDMLFFRMLAMEMPKACWEVLDQAGVNQVSNLVFEGPNAYGLLVRDGRFTVWSESHHLTLLNVATPHLLRSHARVDDTIEVETVRMISRWIPSVQRSRWTTCRQQGFNRCPADSHSTGIVVE